LELGLAHARGWKRTRDGTAKALLRNTPSR
jgi:hypothetical protein